MRRRKLLISGMVVIAALAVAALRSPVPTVQLSVSRVEAMEVSHEDGRAGENWAVTIDVTNLCLNGLTFDDHRMNVSAKLANRWVVVERPGLFHYLSQGGYGDFTILVPPRAEACRISLACSPESVSDKIEYFLRHNRVCRRLPWVCGWAADHTPKPWRRVLVELALPKSPTWAPPKINWAHNESWQPTPGGRPGCFRSLLARRGCTLRYAY
jgi:hypothetical protein